MIWCSEAREMDTDNIAQDQQDPQLVLILHLLNTLMDVLGMEAVVLQAVLSVVVVGIRDYIGAESNGFAKAD